MSRLPSLFTQNMSGGTQPGDVASPAEQRDDAKRNFLKAMRPLPTQHYWHVYFDKQQPSKPAGAADEYQVQLEQLDTQIESVQDFWKYNNNTPVEQIKTRESIYLFKQGFRPVWEDRRNISGGAWTFRVPKAIGPDVWTRVQLMAIGESLQGVLEEGDQLCGVGLSVRFNSHLISVWHRDASKQKSIDAILAHVLEDLPPEMRPKADGSFYKRHQDHPGFKVPPELQAVLDSQKKNEEREKAKAAAAAAAEAAVVPEEPASATA